VPPCTNTFLLHILLVWLKGRSRNFVLLRNFTAIITPACHWALSRARFKPVDISRPQLTNSIEQSPREANSHLAAVEIPRHLWNPKVYYRIHKRSSSPKRRPFTSSHLLLGHSNIIILFVPKPLDLCLPFSYWAKILFSHPPWYDHHNICLRISKGKVVTVSTTSWRRMGSGCIDSRFDLSTSWRSVVSFMPRPLYPRGKSPRYPLDRTMSGPQNRSGRRGENSWPYRDSNSKPSSSSP
jgi:hypothetical protein